MVSINFVGFMFGLLLNLILAPSSLASILRMPICAASNLSSVMTKRFLSGSGNKPNRSMNSTRSSAISVVFFALAIRLY